MIEPLAPLAALVAGLAGSTHCMGMCGPIAALGPGGGQATGSRRFISVLVFNAGRIASYGMAGALVGVTGEYLASLSAWQTGGAILRIALGILLVLIGLSMLLRGRLRLPFERIGMRLWQKIAPQALKLRARSGLTHGFAFGMLWGWLPCGLVYSMLAVAAVSGSAGSGALTMIAFGAGTLPALVSLGTISQAAGALRHPRFRPVLGGFMILCGIWIAAMPASSLLPGERPAHHSGHAHH